MSRLDVCRFATEYLDEMEDIAIITRCIVEMGYFAEYVRDTIMIDGDTRHEPLMLRLKGTVLRISRGRCGCAPSDQIHDHSISKINGKLVVYRDSEPSFDLTNPESLCKLGDTLKMCVMSYHRPSLCSACLAARQQRARIIPSKR